MNTGSSGLALADVAASGGGTTYTAGAGLSLSVGNQFSVAAAQTTISSITAPTNTDLTLATLTNKDIILAPATDNTTGAGRTIIRGGSNVLGGVIASVRRTGDVADLFTFGNAGNFAATTIDLTGGVIGDPATGARWQLGTGGFYLAVGKVINFTGDANSTVSPDVGLARPSAGILKITDGASGGGSLLTAAPTTGTAWRRWSTARR